MINNDKQTFNFIKISQIKQQQKRAINRVQSCFVTQVKVMCHVTELTELELGGKSHVIKYLQ